MKVTNLCVIRFVTMLSAFTCCLGFSQPAFATEHDCCWIDVKTGNRVPTVPATGANYYHGDPDQAGEAGVALLGKDHKTAFNPRTKQNYAKEPDGCWIDVKTGNRVPTVPATGANYYHGDPDQAGEAGIALLGKDRKTAFNPRTKQNFALEPCPPPRAAQQPTPSTTSKVTDVLRTIGSSVSVSIGGGIGGGGGDRHGHHGEGGHRTAEKVRTGDKSRTTSTTSKKTTTGTGHKTVTSGCRCHPCTCSPCTCH